MPNALPLNTPLMLPLTITIHSCRAFGPVVYSSIRPQTVEHSAQVVDSSIRFSSIRPYATRDTRAARDNVHVNKLVIKVIATGLPLNNHPNAIINMAHSQYTIFKDDSNNLHKSK